MAMDYQSYGTNDVLSTMTAATSVPFQQMGTGQTASTVVYDEASECKDSENVCKAPERQRPEFQVSVHRSPKGHRVKLVGGDLDELAPLFQKWADALGKDLRVVATRGMAPYEFYERPLVDMRVGPNTLVLFLTGDPKADEKSDKNPDRNTWRVGLDELRSRAAPAKLDSPEFPAYANIHDDRKTFIGRIEGKYIYTMLYVPEVAKKLPDLVVNGVATMKERHQVKPEPVLVAPLIEHVLTRYQQITERYAREIRGEVTDWSFREFCGDSMRKREKALREKIDQAMSEIRSLEKTMIEKSRTVREGQKEITLLGSGALDTELAKEVRMLHKLVEDGLYEKFKIRHGRIIGMSAPVTIVHEGTKYELGKFLVCIRQNGAIELRHETKIGAAHPHLSTVSEHPCLGNMGSDIPKLIGMERYAMVFQIMHEWLYCYNVGSRHNKIEDCVGRQKVGGSPYGDQAVSQVVALAQRADLAQGVPGADPGAQPERVLAIDRGATEARWKSMTDSVEGGMGEIKREMEHVRSEIARGLGVPRESLRDGPEARTAAADKAMRPAVSDAVKNYKAFTVNVSENEEVG